MERAWPNHPTWLFRQISIDPVKRSLHRMTNKTHQVRRFFAATDFDGFQNPDLPMAAGNRLGNELVDRVAQTALAPVIAQALEMFGDLFGSNFSILKGKITKAQD